MKLGVRGKILIITVTTFLLAISVNTLVISQIFRKGYSAELQSKMAVIAKILRSQIERVIGLGITIDNIEGFEAQCQEILQKHRDVAYAMVTRTNGRILFHNDPTRHDTTINDPEIINALKHREGTTCLSQATGQSYYNTVVPVKDSSDEPGIAVIVGFPTELIDNKIQELRHYSFVVALISLGLTTLLLLTILSVSVMKPLFSLVNTIHHIRDSSDLNRRVVVKSTDEIGQLAISFNQMVEDLEKTTVSRDSLRKEVTERKHAEAALQKSEERFKQVAENAGDWIWEINVEGLYTYSSPNAEKVLGYKAEEIVGKKYFYDFFTPDMKEELKDAAFETFARKETFRNFINPNIHKNGNTVILETNGTPIVDNKGNLCGYRGADRDITEREKADGELTQLLSLHAATLEATADGILVVDSKGKVVSYNRKFLQLWRIPDSLAASREDKKLLAYVLDQLTDPEGFLAEVKRLYTNPQEQSFDLLNFKDGRVFERFSHPQRIDKSIIGRVWSFRDVTGQKNAELALQRLNAKLKASVDKLSNANRELSDFAHIAAHDLKSPLRAIGSLAGIISADYKDKIDERGKEYLGMLLSRAERMSEHLSSILKYSEICISKAQEENADLNIVVTEAISNVDVPENIEVTIENELPTVICDNNRILQVFQNLLDNAVKYMDKPQGLIKIGCVEEDGWWKFNVSDNGPGIDQKYFEKIFQIFQTLTRRDEREATGIGLSEVKKIVELYSGKVWVESEINKGSTFFFTLPKQEMGVKNDELQTNIVG